MKYIKALKKMSPILVLTMVWMLAGTGVVAVAQESEDIAAAYAAFEATGVSGVYEFGMDIECLNACDMNSVGGSIILMYSCYCEEGDYYSRYMLRSVNPRTGDYREIWLGDTDGYYSYYEINDRLFAIYTEEYKSYVLYDATLNERGRLTALFDYEDVKFNSDGRSLWVYNYDSGRIIKRSLSTGEILMEIDAGTENGYLWTGQTGCLNFVTFRGEIYETVNRLFNEQTGEEYVTDERNCYLHVNPAGDRCVLASADPYKIEVYDCAPADIFVTDEDGTISTREPEAAIAIRNIYEFNDCIIDWDNDVLITDVTYYGYPNTVRELKCYSLTTGRELAEYASDLGSSYIWPSVVPDSRNGVTLLLTGEGEHLSLYIWDYMHDTCDDTDDAFLKNSDIPASIESKRRAFEERYGVRMYLGSEVFASSFDYRLDLCSDWDLVEDTIDVLDEVFSIYPDGFFEQIKVGDIKTLGVYLCGGFTKIYSYSADDAIALACSFGYERALALDINYGYCLKRTIVHEVSHWIENKIYTGASFGVCTDFDEGWCALNPSDFSYKNSYVSGKTIWKYIFSSADNTENAYFVDEYSQTYSGEDRAREFEYLMYNEEGNPDYLSSQHMQEKLAYYFTCIREAFDDSDWPEQTSWEMKLAGYAAADEAEKTVAE